MMEEDNDQMQNQDEEDKKEIEEPLVEDIVRDNEGNEDNEEKEKNSLNDNDNKEMEEDGSQPKERSIEIKEQLESIDNQIREQQDNEKEKKDGNTDAKDDKTKEKEDDNANQVGETDIKEPLDNQNSNVNKEDNEMMKSKEEDDKVKRIMDRKDEEYYANYPNLHYNYRTMEKTDNYLNKSKDFGVLPYTYSLKNSTNYISYNDRYYSSFNSIKDGGFDSGNNNANLRSSIESNKEDVLTNKTKRILNSNNPNSNNQFQSQPEPYTNNLHQRSFSSITKVQPQSQPMRNYYGSSFNNRNEGSDLNKEIKPIRDSNKSPSLLRRYDNSIEIGNLTYSINSANRKLYNYEPNPRIEALKEKYKYVSPLKNNNAYDLNKNQRNNSSRISYQYEPYPISRINMSQTLGRTYFNYNMYDNTSYLPPSSSSLNSYSTRYQYRRCCCCHCNRGSFI